MATVAVDDAPGILASYVRAIEEKYALRGRDEVIGYLHAHPGVLPLVEAAPRQIRRSFGSDVRLSLEIARDPEAGPAADQLFIMVATSAPLDHGMRALREVDTRWWLRASRPVRGQVSLDVEFA